MAMARVAISVFNGFDELWPSSAIAFFAFSFSSAGLPYPGRTWRSLSTRPHTPYGFGCIDAPTTAPP